jgi:hypothetical protein
MNDRERWLLLWSTFGGFFGWLTWELKNEKDKCDEEYENYIRRCVRQKQEHDHYDRNG